MQEQLRHLVKLQSLDKSLYELEEEHKTIPGHLAELSLAEEKLSARLKEAQEEIDEVSARRKDLEKDSEGIRSRVRRAENRLMSAKSQREVRAANAEIEEGKDAIKSNDDLVLELMERQEKLQARITDFSNQLEEASAESKKQRTALTKRSNAIVREMNKYKGKRQSLADKVNQELIDQYDFIRKARQGVALAPVKDGICMACHVQIPPQQFNELQKVDRVMSCPTCHRMLYWADAECFTDC